MGKMKEVFMEYRERMLDDLSWNPGIDLKHKLNALEEKGYWIQVSPLSRVNPPEWIAAIYIKGKNAWTTDRCKSGFNSPAQAYEWAEEEIVEIIYNKKRET